MNMIAALINFLLRRGGKWGWKPAIGSFDSARPSKLTEMFCRHTYSSFTFITPKSSQIQCMQNSKRTIG